MDVAERGLENMAIKENIIYRIVDKSENMDKHKMAPD